MTSIDQSTRRNALGGATGDAIAGAATAVMQQHQLPGMVVAWAQVGRQPQIVVLGSDGAGRPLAPDSLFPVASITKLATALAALRLVAANRLSLDDPLLHLLPEAAAARPGVTVRALLSHTAGLPPDVAPALAPYTPGLDWPSLRRACLATPPVAEVGGQVGYSNVGPGLVAAVVERITGTSFAAALDHLVLAPLGVEATLGQEPARAVARIAGEFGRHTGGDLEPFNSRFWRSLALPWAGLVTTASGALALVRAFAGYPAGFLPPALLAEAVSDQSGGAAGGMGAVISDMQWPRAPWGLGVELRGSKEPHPAPAQASASSFGHLGSSGCLAWYDPARDLAWSILGTRSLAGWWRSLPTIGRAILGLS